MANGSTDRRYRFGLYEANLSSGELFRNGQKLKLQEQPFQVLVALLERPGEVVTREDLRQRLWPADTFVDFDHSLNTAINKLRDALGDGASNPRFIETLPRRGYRFIAPVQETASAAQEPQATENTPTSPGSNADAAVIPEAAKAPPSELPRASRRVTRVLFGLLQLMYLVFYGISLWRLDEIGDRAEARWQIAGGPLQALILVTGVVGIALRLYTINATLFDYHYLGRNFRRIFYAVLVLDIIWALSPFLIVQYIGVGLAFAACAALLYSPFAQRVLAVITWAE